MVFPSFLLVFLQREGCLREPLFAVLAFVALDNTGVASSPKGSVFDDMGTTLTMGVWALKFHENLSCKRETDERRAKLLSSGEKKVELGERFSGGVEKCSFIP